MNNIKMKVKIIVWISVVFLTLTSCKNDKNIDSLEVVKPEISTNSFKITLEVIVKKDDDFALFYTTDGTTDFKLEPIWQSVKGKETSQEVTFNLPMNIAPTQLRMDFGLKENQENIILKSVLIENKDKKRKIEEKELANFFRADENKCTFDAASGVIIAVVKEGIRQIPSIYPQEVFLGPELNRMQ